MKEIGCKEFKAIVRNGIENLCRERERMNRINVFPVPDGDTGDNLAFTLRPIQIALEQRHEDRVDELAFHLSQQMLTTAKGNAGVIFSQFFSGFTRALKGKAAITPSDFGLALENGVKESYRAVASPREGTILTVIRHAAQEFKQAAEKEEYFHRIFEWVSQRTREILEKTREMLPQLKKAQVVDAGGLGFYLFFEGMTQAVTGRTAEPVTFSEGLVDLEKERLEIVDDGVCAEWVIHPRGKDGAYFGQKLQELGNSLVVAGDEHILHIHIHTQNPGEVESALAEHAAISSRKWETIYEHQWSSPQAAAAMIVDSAIDIPADVIVRQDIRVVPLQIAMDDVYHREGLDLSKAEFYQRLAANPEMKLKTSQPAIADFLAPCQEAAQKSRHVLIFTLSSLLSGSFQGATAAARSLPEEQGVKVRVVDTKNVSAGSGLLVLAALQMLARGESPDAVASRTEELRTRVVSLGYVDNLDYAVRGGRISRSLGTLARLLNLKPLVAFCQGKLVRKGILLGSHRKERRTVSRLLRGLDRSRTHSVGIAYTDNPEAAEAAERELRKSGLSISFIYRICAAAALGAHAGPGTFCLWALPDD